MEGPLAAVRGIRPHELRDDGVPEHFVRLWVATRVALRSVLDVVTIADLANQILPPKVEAAAPRPRRLVREVTRLRADFEPGHLA